MAIRVLKLRLVLVVCVLLGGLLPLLGSPSSRAMAASPLTSYAYQQQVTVTGGSAAAGGSTTTPVPVTSTDYVVMLHLTGSHAAAVYNNAAYNATTTFNGTPFADVTMWYTGGSSPQQIDVDYDTATYGAWSASNITLWFKLQRPLAAAPATDTGYTLAWGNTAPTVMRNWANIYPFQDDFTGTTLDGTKWTNQGSASVSLGNSTVTISGGHGDHQIASIPTFGPGYISTMYGTLPPSGDSNKIAKLVQWPSTGGVPESNLLTDGASWRVTQWNGSVARYVSFGNTDSAKHIFAIGRASNGLLTGFFDGIRYPVASGAEHTNAMPVALDVYNGSDNTPVNLTADWIKVRPWISGSAPVASVAFPPVPLSALPYRETLPIMGGSSPVSGSTTTPAPVDSRDYVVLVHLTGSQAAYVYNHVADPTAFSDVTIWDTGGSTPRQLDVDLDQTTFGPWSATNVALWFRLQRPLGAAPAIDAGYALAWGNPNVATLQNWANIYPFFDDFSASSYDPSSWNTYNSAPPIAVGSGLITITTPPGGNTDYFFQSNAQFGTGYEARMWGALPPTASENGTARIGWRTNGDHYADTEVNGNHWKSTAWATSGSSFATPFSLPPDSAFHTFSVARDTGGQIYSAVDATRLTTTTGQVTGPQNLQLSVWDNGGVFAQLVADWVKVRPWISGTEPSVANNASAPPASGSVPWHPHYRQSLSFGLGLSVDLSDGHLDLSASDLHLPGRGLDLALGHTWDSTLAQAGVTTGAGQGWSDSLAPSMGGTLTGTVTYTDATGATYPFTYAGSPTDPGPYTTYSGVPGQPWQLAASTAGYTLTDILNGDVRIFDTQGRLQGDADSYGNSNTLAYSGANSLPDSESNSGGRAFHFSAANGLLQQVQSPAHAVDASQGQDVTYTYTGTLLASITRGHGTTDAATTKFGYSPDGTQLTTVTTPAGHVWCLQYDPYGRVSQLTSPVSGTLGQAGYTPAYTTAFTYTPGQTVVVEGAGTSAALATTYTLDGQGEATAVADALGDTTRSTYDADHDVLSSTDANGNTTTDAYAYVGAPGPSGIGSVGLLTQTVQPALSSYLVPGGLSNPVVITNRYDPSTYDLLETDRSPSGGITEYGYASPHTVMTTTELLGTTTSSGSGCGNAPSLMTPQGRFWHVRHRRDKAAAALSASGCVTHTTYTLWAPVCQVASVPG